jgi:glyoxylase-like metal-dependent hydrolase (beta-lactamase superfamily II)
MIEEIADSFFRIEIPLPDNPLRSLNSYVIRTSDRHLIIDTGFDLPECFNAMHEGLEKLDIRLEDSDFFITHMHSDHAGLVTRLISDTSKVYFNKIEVDFLMNIDIDAELSRLSQVSGLSDEVINAMINLHLKYQYDIAPWISRVTFVDEGDILQVGNYTFRTLVTPGHTKGHTCLYEPEQKILVSGDHILYDITPSITCWADNENRLKDYISSLDRIYDMDVDLVLPGHRSVFTDFRDRIDEIKHHHNHRGSDVAAILEGGALNVAQIAAKMKWDIKCDSWESFPKTQKWFAAGEAMAHLRYMEEEGRVIVEKAGGNLFFGLANR